MAEMTILLYSLVQVVDFFSAVISRTRKFLNFIVKSALSHLHVGIQKNNLQALQIDGECVLHDVMDIVCEYADANSLYNMTEVCKSWRVAALREKNKRMHLIEHWNGSFLKLSDLRSKIKAIPFVSLFIYKKSDVSSLILHLPRQNMLLDDNVNYSKALCEHMILKNYKEQLPKRALAFRVDQYFTMENGRLKFIKEQRQNQGERTRDRNILGLLFPSTDPRVRFHAATIVDDMRNEQEDAVGRLTEELGFNDSNCKHSKSTILMFSIFSSNPFVGPVIEQLIKRQAEKRKEITFAGFYGSLVRISDDDRACVCCGELRMLLRISGPRVESWSTFIYFHTRDFGDIISKLNELKSRVKSKRHNIGLVYTPRCITRGCNHAWHPCGDSTLLMKTITRVFPYIRFTGIFINYVFRNEDHSGTFLANENDYCSGDLVEKQGSCYHVSIIIISHD